MLDLKNTVVCDWQSDLQCISFCSIHFFFHILRYDSCWFQESSSTGIPALCCSTAARRNRHHTLSVVQNPHHLKIMPSERQREQKHKKPRDSFPVHPRASGLLALIRNANGLSLISHGHTRRSLFGTDSTRLALVLDERNTLSARHQSDFLETLESAEDGRQTLLARVVGELPQEEDLIGRQVLVWHDSGRSTGGRLEAGSLGCLGWARSVSSGSGGALESLLGFEGVVGLFPFCLRNGI